MKNIRSTVSSDLSRDRALVMLKPHLADLSGSVTDAWAVWESRCQTFPEDRVKLSDRSRASIVYDYMKDSATRRFTGKPDVYLSNKRGYLSVTICGKVVIRFKKFDKYRRVRSIPTRQYNLFMLQQSLEGFELVNLVTGYRVDDLQTGIAEVLIACPSGAKNLWYADITTEIPPQVESISPEPLEERPIVRPKRTATKKLGSK